MNVRSTRGAASAIVLPFLLLPLTGCDIVTADFKHAETAEWRKSYDLQPGGRVDITNVNGRIEVEPATGNMLEVIVEKTAKGASVEAAKAALERIQIVEEASPAAVRVETRVQRSGGLFDTGSSQVRYRVRVPNGADVRFSTTNGGIQLSGLIGRINARTTNGGITARDVAGQIEARTTNGGVDVDLARVTDGGARLECTNGGIRLRLPSDARATISARVSNGGIDTSGLSLDSTENTRRRLEARLNGGGPSIVIEGTNGGIRIAPR